MKKILSLFFVLTLTLVSLVTLTACDKTKAEDLLRTFLIEEDGKNVKDNFSVPSELTFGKETYELSWTTNSSNLTVGEKVDKNYVINVARPAEDEVAKLTVTLSLSKKNTASKDFTIYLSPIDVYDFVDEFSQPGVFKESGTNVSADFALATEYALEKYPNEKATITWESSNTDALAISEDGKTALVYPSSEEVNVRLTAKFTYKGEESQARFSVKVSSPKTPFESLMYWYNNTGITQTLSGYVVCEAAVYSESYGNISLYILDDTLQGGYYLYRTKVNPDEAAKLYDENGKIKLGTHVTVTGATNTSYSGLMETNAGGDLVVDTDVTPINVEETYYAIDNDLVANAQSLYYRTSTLVTLTNWKVKEIKDLDKVMVAGGNDTILILEKNGVETTVRFSKYIQNALGEDNAAAFKAGLAGIAVGDYVNVKGLLSYYNKNSDGYDQKSYQILMTAPNSVTKGTQDDAELPGVKVGAALEAFDTLAELYVAPTEVTLPTELNGVTIAWSIPESNVAKSVALEGNKLTLTPQTKLETVNVIGTYTNGAYSTVVYYSFKTQSLSDAEMIEKALEELTIEDQYAPSDVTLPAANELYGVTFTYALKGTPTSVTLANGVLTVNNATLTENEKVTLVVTATKGEETKSSEVEITVHKLNAVTVTEFIKKADKDSVALLHGYVTAVASSSGKGSFILTDLEGNSIFCYDKDLDVKLGDEIEVLAKYSEYSGFHQMAKPVLVRTVSTGNDAAAKSGTPVEVTAEALAKDIAALSNAELITKYTGKYLVVKGYVIQVNGNYALAATANGSMVVNIYTNSTNNFADELGKEITLYGFSRGIKAGAEGNITIQTQKFEGKPLTDAEKVMNCVSWKEVTSKYGQNSEEAIAWCSNHNFYNNGAAVTSCTMPSYCQDNTAGGNNFGFNIDNIEGSSSDILASLQAWADAKDSTKTLLKDDTTSLTGALDNVSTIVGNLSGIGGAFTSTETSADKLANTWGYDLFEFAHNNVCSRVLDSCFNGIYEACGNPTAAGGIGKCADGQSSTNCPFNYNSKIAVGSDGDIELFERKTSSTNNSAVCFGYNSANGDPYSNLRGPVADARRSIMNKYLLDANADCDVYGEQLRVMAQNIGYQKVAAQQALQQKRLEFATEEKESVLNSVQTAYANFNECLSEIWECYEETSDSEPNWTTSRIKTYCAQIANVPHCYEEMICQPSGAQFVGVINLQDNEKCVWSNDYTKNTCRNVVTLNEILNGAATETESWEDYSESTKTFNSAKLREGCLREALNMDDKTVTAPEDSLRNWKKVVKTEE